MLQLTHRCPLDHMPVPPLVFRLIYSPFAGPIGGGNHETQGTAPAVPLARPALGFLLHFQCGLHSSCGLEGDPGRLPEAGSAPVLCEPVSVGECLLLHRVSRCQCMRCSRWAYAPCVFAIMLTSKDIVHGGDPVIVANRRQHYFQVQ